ncbi:hypothetical protein BH10BAC5_BH10BAC5_01020 [soil metagenome]
MKYSYLIKESLRGFSSAKISTFASIITITLSLIIIAIYFSLSLSSSKLTRSIKEKVELEAFIQDSYNINELDSLKEKIKRIGGVKQVSFISKEEAAKIFEKDYGKEMLELFETNPLPASFKVNLYDEYKTVEKIEKIKKQISEQMYVTDVVYPQKNLEMIEKSTSGILFLNLVILVIITLSSIFLVSNTIRLVISSKVKLINTLKLLGATRSYIRSPFLIEGLLQGFIGGIIAIFILYGIFEYFTKRFSQSNISIEVFGLGYFLLLLLLGMILGISGSAISIRRFLKFEN